MHTAEIPHREGSLPPPMGPKMGGKCVGTSVWGALCADVRGHILSKLSLREHASAAPMACRGFREDFVNRVANERAASISLAEGTIGKEVFRAFVIAVQRLMCGLLPYASCPPPPDTPYLYLVITAAGNMELMTQTDKRLEEKKKKAIDEGGATIWIGESDLIGNVYPNIPACKEACISLLFTEAHNNSSGVHAYLWREVAAAGMGLLLAICTGNTGATAAHWKRPLREINLTDCGEAYPPTERDASSGSELPAPSLAYSSHFDRVYYGPDLDLDGKSADQRASCEAAARTAAAVGTKGWGSDWHGEGLGLCAFLLANPTMAAAQGRARSSARVASTALARVGPRA